MKKEVWVKPETKAAFEAKLLECHTICQKHTEKVIPLPKMVFKRLGTNAGECSTTEEVFYINPDYFDKHYDDMLNSTLPHEFAHFVDVFLFGFRRIRGRYVKHGDSWRQIMGWLGLPANVCHSYDDTNAKLRQVNKPFRYTCGCPNFNHDVTTRVHLKQQTRKSNYKCRKCGHPITFVGTVQNGVFQPKGTPNTPAALLVNRRTFLTTTAPIPIKVWKEPAKFRTVTKFVNGVLTNERIAI